MQIISSYGVELRKQNIPIRQTLKIYRSAVSYLMTQEYLMFEDEIDCRDLFEGNDDREKILIFQLL